MARRRLGPGSPPDGGGVGNVPRAERPGRGPFDQVDALAPEAAPIARIASDAAGAAALQEMTETWQRARDSGRLVLDLPLAQIAPDHLLRDRLPAADAEMAALCDSLRANGQRTPIEVTPLVGLRPYGLLSGWRRHAALTALHAETGEARFSTVQALVRHPAGAAEAYVGMVEENEIRLGLSQYERARIAALAAAQGVFADEEAAVRTLFATASRPKRSRIRAFLEIYHALEGHLRFPAHLPERLGLRLVERIRAGEGPRLVAALARSEAASPEAEQTLLTELAALKRRAPQDTRRPRRLLPGVTLAETLRGQTLTLRLEGPGVTTDLAKEIRTRLDTLRG